MEILLWGHCFFLLYLIVGTIVSRTKIFKKWYKQYVFRDRVDVESGVPRKYEFGPDFSMFFLALCIPQILLMWFYDSIKYLIE